MFEQITDQEKYQRYSIISDYSTLHTQLYSTDTGLACFTLVNASPTVQQRQVSGISYFLGPQNLIWVPGVTPDSAVATGLFESNANSIRVFVRRILQENWFDIGIGRLNGIRRQGPSVGELALCEINVRLAVKLPESLWQLFGGHPGWCLVVNSVELEVFDPTLVLDAVQSVWDRSTVDLEISRYAGDSLFAIADESGRAAVLYNSDSGTYVSCAEDLQRSTGSTYIFHRSDGWDYEVPLDQVITRAEALSILDHHVKTGNPRGLRRLP